VAKTHEEIKADQRAYYQKNKETLKQKAKEYYEAHKDDLRPARKKWQQENLDRHREYNQRSYQKDPAKTLVRVRARKIKMLGNGIEPYTLEQVLEEYGPICYLCEVDIDLSLPRKIGIAGWEKGLHLDHVTPISKGGSDCLENVAPTHAICNLNKRGN
jgi:5-methylcytosine-specific restriction endonuclease McrA